MESLTQLLTDKFEKGNHSLTVDEDVDWRVDDAHETAEYRR